MNLKSIINSLSLEEIFLSNNNLGIYIAVAFGVVILILLICLLYFIRAKNRPLTDEDYQDTSSLYNNTKNSRNSKNHSDIVIDTSRKTTSTSAGRLDD